MGEMISFPTPTGPPAPRPSDEWDVVRDYLDDVVSRAVGGLKPEAAELRYEYALLESELAGARELFAELTARDATIKIIAEPVWKEAQNRFDRRWQPFLSSAANLDMRIKKKVRRGKSRHIDHDLDDVVALDIVRLAMEGKHTTVRADILAAAEKHNVKFRNANERDAFCKRIGRILESPHGPAARLLKLMRERADK